MRDYIGNIRERFKRMQRLLSNEESNKKELTLYYISDTDPKNIEHIREVVKYYNKGIREQWKEIETGLEQWLEINDHEDIAPSNAQPHIAIEQEINLKVIPIPRDSKVDLDQVTPILREFEKLEQTQIFNPEKLQIIKKEYLEYVNPPEDQTPYGGDGQGEYGIGEPRKRKGEKQLKKGDGKHAKSNSGNSDLGNFEAFMENLSGEGFGGPDGAATAPAARVSLPSVWHVV